MNYQLLNENELIELNGGSPRTAKFFMVFGGCVLLGLAAPIAGAACGTAALVEVSAAALGVVCTGASI